MIIFTTFMTIFTLSIINFIVNCSALQTLVNIEGLTREVQFSSIPLLHLQIKKLKTKLGILGKKLFGTVFCKCIFQFFQTTFIQLVPTTAQYFLITTCVDIPLLDRYPVEVMINFIHNNQIAKCVGAVRLLNPIAPGDAVCLTHAHVQTAMSCPMSNYATNTYLALPPSGSIPDAV